MGSGGVGWEGGGVAYFIDTRMFQDGGEPCLPLIESRAERGSHYSGHHRPSGTQNCGPGVLQTDNTYGTMMMLDFSFKSGPDPRCKCSGLLLA